MLYLRKTFKIMQIAYCRTASQSTKLKNSVTNSVIQLLFKIMYPTKAKNTLLALIENIAKHHKYNTELNPPDIHMLSSGDEKLCTALFLVILTSINRKDLMLFAKVSIKSEHNRAMDPRDLFKSEICFYTKIKPAFEELEDEHNIDGENRLITPKYFGSNDEYLNEIIVIEDLMIKGYKSFDKDDVVTLDLAVRAVEELAKFHALVFACLKEYPKESDDVLENFKLNVPTVEAMKNMFNNQIDKVYELLTDVNRNKVKEFLKSGDRIEEMFQSLSTGKTRVLVHGDFKISNLMYRQSNQRLELVTLDFQHIHVGSVVADLMYFLFLSTDEQFRRHHYHQLLDQYHDQLGQAMVRLGLEVEEVFPREVYREEVRELSLFGLVVGVVFLPAVTQQDPGAEDQLEDLAPSILYKELLNGILNNYREWGLL